MVIKRCLFPSQEFPRDHERNSCQIHLFFLRQTGNKRIFRSIEYDTMRARGVYKLCLGIVVLHSAFAQSPRPVDFVVLNPGAEWYSHNDK